MGVPYTFSTSTSSIPLSQLDTNFATPVTIGSTTVALGNTTTTLAGLTGVTSSVITDSGLTSGRVTYATTGGLLNDSANLLYSGTDLTVYGITVGRGAGSVALSTAVGAGALALNTTGTATAVGANAAAANTTGSITAIGYNSLANNTTGTSIVAVGGSSFLGNITGGSSVAFGQSAGTNMSTGVATFGSITGGSGYTDGTYSNVLTSYVSGTPVLTGGTYPNVTVTVSGGAVTSVVLTSTVGTRFIDTTTVLTVSNTLIGGTGSGFTIPVATLATGTANSFFGSFAGNSVYTGSNNVGIGLNVMVAGVVNNSIGIGHRVMRSASGFANANIGIGGADTTAAGTTNGALGSVTGSNNTVVGVNAGLTVSTGSGNQFYGYNSGNGVTTGSKNTIIGSYTGSAAPISATGSNYVVLSDGDGNIRMYFNGSIAIFNGTISPVQATTASAPAYVKGAMYFDTTLNKLRIGGATAWETVPSV